MRDGQRCRNIFINVSLLPNEWMVIVYVSKMRENWMSHGLRENLFSLFSADSTINAVFIIR